MDKFNCPVCGKKSDDHTEKEKEECTDAWKHEELSGGHFR